MNKGREMSIDAMKQALEALEMVTVDARIKEAVELRLQMDLRDYFAAKAMNAFLIDVDVEAEDLPSIANSAYMVADAMMQEREK